MKRIFLWTTVCAISVPAEAGTSSCDVGDGALASGTVASANVLLTGAASGDAFGHATAIGDFDGDGQDDLVVSAPDADNGASNTGEVYVFYGPLTTTPESSDDADVVLSVTVAGARVGYSLANVGDLDSDGKDELVIGSFSGGPGRAFVVKGSTLTGVSTLDLVTSADVVLEGQKNGDKLGAAVASLGDIGGDGVPEVLIAAPRYDAGAQSNAGAVYIVSGANLLAGGSHKIETAASARFVGANRNAYFGTSVGEAGDLDNDGTPDFVVGSVGDTAAGRDTGAFYAFRGQAWGQSNTTNDAWAVWRGKLGDRAGRSVAPAGDVNGDGADDVWVGVNTQTVSNKGAAYLMLGRSGVTTLQVGKLDALAHVKLTGPSGAYAGRAIASGDLDHDGKMDVVVGGNGGKGAAWLAYGPPTAGATGLAGGSDVTFAGVASGDRAGWSVSIGDLNGDLVADVIVGAPSSGQGVSNGGLVSIAFGGASNTEVTWYQDSDGDSYGLTANAQQACSQPVGYVLRGEDCDDGNASAYPGAPETCSDGDLNCDGASGNVDGDGDGYDACVECDDGDASVSPAADEVCGDGVDNNCDGQVDDATSADATSYYPDIDGDGYGDTSAAVRSCTPYTFPAGVTTLTLGGDCDDADATRNPLALEVCDGVDNNCLDGVDEASAADARLWYADGDSDGHGSPSATSMACTQPTGSVAGRGDCLDTNASVSPVTVETCDGQDNDCSGMNYLGGLTPGALPLLTIDGTAPNGGLGFAAAYLPDMDNDGDDELLIAAPTASTGVAAAGIVYVVPGSADGRASGSLNATTSAARLLGVTASSEFGRSVVTGDFDGDGTMDVAVGAPGDRAPSPGQGSVYVFYGPVSAGDTLASAAHAVFRGTASGSRLGVTLATADVDGDGTTDLIAGSPARSESLSRRGKVYVFYGGARRSGTAAADDAADAWMLGTTSQEYAGATLAVGDLDGDGADDIVAGAPRYGSFDNGSGYVWYGNTTRQTGAAAGVVRLSHAVRGAQLGIGLAIPGDMNGDGYDELFIGTVKSRGYLLLGSGTRLATTTDAATQALVTFRGATSQLVAKGAASAGDVDEDGLSDLFIAAPGDSGGGALFLVYGRSDLATAVTSGSEYAVGNLKHASSLGAGNLEGARIQQSAQGSSGPSGLVKAGVGGDFDGDGHDDLALGQPDGAGSLTLYLGGPGRGIDDDVSDGTEKDWYVDADADTFTVLFAEDTCASQVPAGAVNTGSDPADCDDANASVYPGATETDGDGVDSNCDGHDDLDQDSDGDGLTDVAEAALGTDPNDADSDDDGLSDGDEVNTHNTLPLNADTDGDGLSDGQEVNVGSTDPRNPMDPMPDWGISSIFAGWASTCAVLGNGEAKCWGKSERGYLAPPALPTGKTWKSLSPGNELSCGLFTDGTATCWAAPTFLNGAPPALPSGVTYTKLDATAESHACALRSDGQVVCWGTDNSGSTTVPTPPAGTTFIDVDVEGKNSCAVVSDGSLMCWGDAELLMLPPPPPPVGDTFATVSIGTWGICGHTAARELICWGDYGYNNEEDYPGPDYYGVAWDKFEFGGRRGCATTVVGEMHLLGRPVQLAKRSVGSTLLADRGNLHRLLLRFLARLCDDLGESGLLLG